MSEVCARGPATEERVSRELFERAELDGVSEDCVLGPATEERVSRELLERAEATA